MDKVIEFEVEGIRLIRGHSFFKARIRWHFFPQEKDKFSVYVCSYGSGGSFSWNPGLPAHDTITPDKLETIKKFIETYERLQ